MKNFLRVIGIFTIFLFGLTVGSAVAAVFTPTSGNDAIDGGTFEKINELAFSTAISKKRGTRKNGSTENGGYGIAGLDMSGVEAYQRAPGAIVERISRIDEAMMSSRIYAAPLRVKTTKTNSDYRVYAMLLVGLGLVGFTTRTRQNISSS